MVQSLKDFKTFLGLEDLTEVVNGLEEIVESGSTRESDFSQLRELLTESKNIDRQLEQKKKREGFRSTEKNLVASYYSQRGYGRLLMSIISSKAHGQKYNKQAFISADEDLEKSLEYDSNGKPGPKRNLRNLTNKVHLGNAYMALGRTAEALTQYFSVLCSNEYKEARKKIKSGDPKKGDEKIIKIAAKAGIGLHQMDVVDPLHFGEQYGIINAGTIKKLSNTSYRSS